MFERGKPKTYEGEALMRIGMPVGGVCAGLVYLGGDGKLWYWDIFNRYLSGVQPRQIQYKGRSWHGLPQGLGAWQGGNYIDPITTQPCPFEQGFALKVSAGGTTQVRTLDRKGWKHVSFTGTYPVGTIRYSDPDCPVKVTLEAYSPFCPLDFDNSSYPATVMRYTLGEYRQRGGAGGSGRLAGERGVAGYGQGLSRRSAAQHRDREAGLDAAVLCRHPARGAAECSTGHRV